jgi:ABC-2 type transport system ATP-binding protein
MNDEALTIRGLTKNFPGFQLGPIDITVPKGAIYGLIGPNGAGKTTTIDLVMGMGREEAGTVHVFGLDHTKEEVAVKRQVGYVSPDLVFSAWGKVGRLLGFIRSFYPDWDDAYCSDLLERFQIELDDKIATLSFGARTKLGLIVALAHRPALLLLDEPQAGLDAVSKRELFTELLAAVQDADRTVLISSHNLDDIERFADYVGIINKGKMLVEGATSDLLERFRMVDCIAESTADPTEVPGVSLQHQDGQRYRLLVDTTGNALDRLKAQGLTDLAEAPVTLEELFIGLVKEGYDTRPETVFV